MKRLFFVRHGESEADARGVWSPLDVQLTPTGRWQATAAGCDARERGLEFGAIISSPLPRAHETARLIADELDYDIRDIELFNLLTERQWGELIGQKREDFFTGGRTHKHLEELESTEKLHNLQMRAHNALSALYDRPEENILLVGHNSFGRALVRAIKGEPAELEFQTAGDADHDLPHSRIIQLI